VSSAALLRTLPEFGGIHGLRVTRRMMNAVSVCGSPFLPREVNYEILETANTSIFHRGYWWILRSHLVDVGANTCRGHSGRNVCGGS
jgi:hypothetical protein